MRCTSSRFGPLPAAAVDATRTTAAPAGIEPDSLRSHAISPSRSAVPVSAAHVRPTTPWTSASLKTTAGSGEKAKIGTRGRSEARMRAVDPVRV